MNIQQQYQKGFLYKITSKESIKHIKNTVDSCFGSSDFIVYNNELYSWVVDAVNDEYNSNFILGDSRTENIKTPQKVSIITSAIDSISISRYHGLALTVDGEVYSWGKNEYKQCGFNTIGSYVAQKIPNLQNIKYIVATSYNSFFIDKTEKIYIIGKDYIGNLFEIPTLLNLPFKVVDICNTYNYEKSFVYIDENGNLHAFDWCVTNNVINHETIWNQGGLIQVKELLGGEVPAPSPFFCLHNSGKILIDNSFLKNYDDEYIYAKRIFNVNNFLNNSDDWYDIPYGSYENHIFDGPFTEVGNTVARNNDTIYRLMGSWWDRTLTQITLP